MNTRRAANRARSLAAPSKPERAATLRYSEGESHMQMRGRKIAHREPAHHEKGGNHRHEAHASHGSPASRGASKGAGPLPGAGMLDSPGSRPGPAAKRVMERDRSESPSYPTPPGTPPKGMSTYSEE